PVRKAAPVDYVRVCSAYGTGFFYIPGTDTCLRVSGFVRAQYSYTPASSRLNVVANNGVGAARDQNTTNFFARGRMNFDTRTGTEFGLLRTFTSIDYNANQGGGDTLNVINAYIQFGGLTAGRIQSFFMYKWGNGINNLALASTDLTYGTTNVLAYTASFGQGFSATVSLEDPVRRRGNGIQRTNDAGVPGALRAGAAYGGVQLPDLVANLNLSQSWGNARLAVALHDLRTSSLVSNVAGQLVRPTSRVGWAVLGGVEFNLPMLGSRSSIWLQGTYSDGANSYAAHNAGTFNGRQLAFTPANAYVNGVTGSLGTTKIWGLSAGLTHNWTPQWQSQLQANYQQVRLPGWAQIQAVGGVLPNHNANSQGYDLWAIGHTLTWTPVSGLAFMGEVQYAQAQAKQRAFAVNNAVNAPRRTSDIWSATLRIQRSF
ncbi:MAG: porin, partial [Salinarimonas sp.]